MKIRHYRINDREEKGKKMGKMGFECERCGVCRFVPEYGMLIARVLVTPTRIVCLAPEVTHSH